MLIHELSRRTGVPTKTIRYYEEASLLPSPERAENNYRQYGEAAVGRVLFVKTARNLGFGVNDIAEFLAAREKGLLPCQRVLNSLDARIAEIDRRIADLLTLRELLIRIRNEGTALPADDDPCVCYLLTLEGEGGQIIIEKEKPRNVKTRRS